MSQNIKDFLSKLDPETVEFLNFLSAMHMDVDTALKTVNTDGSQYNRRQFLRCFYSYIEGSVTAFKDACLHLNKKYPDLNLLSLAEIVLLQDLSFEISDKGEPKQGTRYPKFENNLKFTFDVYSRLFFTAVQVDPQHDGGRSWNALKDFVKIRHRITHPKKAADYSINDRELAICIEAHEYIQGLVLRSLRNCHANPVTGPKYIQDRAARFSKLKIPED